jgi:glucokinase
VGGATSQGGLARVDAASSLIAADVGGTHARLALLDAGPSGGDDFAILEYRKYVCADYPSLAAIIDAFRASLADSTVDRIARARPGDLIQEAVVNQKMAWWVWV